MIHTRCRAPRVRDNLWRAWKCSWCSEVACVRCKQAAPEDATPAGQLRRRRNKRGNPLEFFRLLTSLTKRW